MSQPQPLPVSRKSLLDSAIAFIFVLDKQPNES